MTPAEKKQAIGDALDYWYLLDFLSQGDPALKMKWTRLGPEKECSMTALSQKSGTTRT